MILNVCCPHDSCGTFQKALNWLKSFGIEPALEHDGEGYYFKFTIPSEWELEKKIDFNWQIANKIEGMVLCRCERWLNVVSYGLVYRHTCKDCGREYMFCTDCNAIDHWEGSYCQKSCSGE
jgi:hypothetical protein